MNKIMKKLQSTTAQNILVIMLVCINFVISAYFNVYILESTPHVSDSAVYYRQAILLSKGHLFLHNFTREPAEAFEIWGVLKNNTVIYPYNHFWPALLGLGIKLGIPEFVNPLLSALSVFLVYLICSRLYNKKVGCIAALLYSVSPFVIIMAGDYMMHIATNFFLLAAFYCLLVYFQDDNFYFMLLSGAFFGYAFGLRQVTATFFILPIFAYFAFFYRKQLLRMKSLSFLIGMIPLLLLFFADNAIITGNYFTVAHPAVGDRDILTFLHSLFSEQLLTSGLNEADSALGFLPPIIFYGFLPMFFLAFSFLPLLVLRNKQDYLLMSIFVSLVVSQILIPAGGLHGYGPRYFFESIFVFYILAARGMYWFLENSAGLLRISFCTIFILMVMHNISGLYAVLPSYHSYNSVYTSPVKILKTATLNDSIIIIPGDQSFYITTPFWDPEFKESFFIRELSEGRHNAIFVDNPERKVYRLESDKLVPYNWNSTVNGGSVNT